MLHGVALTRFLLLYICCLLSRLAVGKRTRSDILLKNLMEVIWVTEANGIGYVSHRKLG
jgi:hypothetical protein